MPSNVALCVGPKIEYVIVETYNPYDAEKLTLVMAASRVAAYLKSEGEITDGGELPAYDRGDKYVPYRIVGRVMGTELEGLHYRQLMLG